MVDAQWLAEQVKVKVVVGGVEWLNGFHKHIREEDLATEDKKYLDELEEWLADEEDNRRRLILIEAVTKNGRHRIDSNANVKS